MVIVIKLLTGSCYYQDRICHFKNLKSPPVFTFLQPNLVLCSIDVVLSHTGIASQLENNISFVSLIKNYYLRESVSVNLCIFKTQSPLE